MADEDIYLVPTANILQWGRRIYYANCHREGGDYRWHEDNLETAVGAPKTADISVKWLFKNAWNPIEK
jgi:pectinesterase